MNKLEMVVINGDTIIKKQFEVINDNEVISFNLGKFTLAVRKEDLVRIVGGTNDAIHKRRC